MKKNLQFLFSLVAMMLFALTAKAQVYIETDLTSQFSALTVNTNWTTGAGGTAGTAPDWACPAVAVNGLGNKAPCEFYEGSCERTGDLLYQTVTGLAAGTYKIELYGAAAYTFGRGFASEAFAEGTWNAGDKIEPSEEVSTGVVLYAEAEGRTYGGEIPIYYATSFPDGAATVTLSGIVVGESGSIKIGMTKTSKSTNWHVIQLKGVTAQVDAAVVLANSVAKAEAIEESTIPATLYAEIQSVLSENNKEFETADEYIAAIAAIDAVVAKATSYPAITALLAQGENFKANVSDEEIIAAYTTAIVDVQSAYDAATIEDFDAAAATITAALPALAKAQTVEGADVTLAIANAAGNLGTNASVEGWTCTNAQTFHINTWSVEGNAGNDPSGMVTPFIENWIGKNDGVLGDGKIYQTITGLQPNTIYQLTGLIRAYSEAGNDLGGAALYAGEAKADLAVGINFTYNGMKGIYDTYKIQGTTDEVGNLEVGFVIEGATFNWLALKNFTLTYIGEATDRSALDAEIAIAEELGVDKAYTDFLKTQPVTADQIEGLINTLKEKEYVAANANYPQDAAILIPDFAEWTGDMVSNKGQHWDGTSTSTYYEQTGAQWGQSSWTNSKTTTVTLPKGKYVLYAAGRGSAGGNCKVYIKVNDVEREYTTKGDVGYGVATDGTASFAENATYANDGKGRGFEYRYITFEVAEEEGAEVTLTIGGEATANHQWMSFTAPVLRTTEDNTAIADQIAAAELAAAKAELTAALTEADAIVEAKAGVGEGLFLIPEEAFTAYEAAVAEQKAVATNEESTKEDVDAAIEALAAAKATYQASALAPEADKAYAIANVTATDTYLAFGSESVKLAEEAAPVYFTAVEGGYILANADGEYIFKTTNNNWTLSTTTDAAAAYILTFAAVENGYTISGAKGIMGTDETAAGSSVYANKAIGNNGVWTIAEYVAPADPNDFTSYIVNADLTGEGGFDATGTKGIDGSGIVKAGNNAQFDFKQTIENLPSGKYLLTAQAAYRYSGSEADEAAAIEAGTETKFATLYATVGETTETTLVQNRYDGASETDLAGEGAVQVNDLWVPNSSNAVKAWFAAGKYVNEVEFNLPADGDVTIGIVKTAQPEAGDYTVIGPWTLTRLGDAESDEPTYAVTIAEGIENGTVAADAETAAEGATVTLTVEAAEGYELESLAVTYVVPAAEEGQDPTTATVEVAEDYTFVMPAAAVAISATFKAVAEPEPEPEPAATLTHTAGSSWGSNANKNTVDSEAEYYNNEVATGWAGVAFADFALNIPNGATITSATLTWTTITGGRANTTRDNKVYYLNAGEQVDFDAIAAEAAEDVDDTPRLYTDAKTFIANYTGQNTFNGELDVTEAVQAIKQAGQNYIVFQWTGNTAGAQLAGKASENAPKLVVEYIPGAPELVNPAFDANAENVITVTTQDYQRNVTEGQVAGMQPVEGWTPGTQTESDPGYSGGVFAYGSENLLNNKVAAPAAGPEGEAEGVALALSAVWAGVAQYTQDVTLPAGDYKFTYVVYNGVNTGAVTKNLFGFIAEDGTEYLSDQKTFTVGEWATVEVPFTLAEETTGKISVGFIGSGGSGNAPHLFVDHVALDKVPGVEVALLDLAKAIETAQAQADGYAVGEGLFQYVASEIAPITEAIATAQAAYDAAESKEAVEAATTALSEFVAAFAPAITAPEADKAYLFELNLGGETPLYMSLAESGITIAEAPTAIKFVETENAGQYYLVSEDEEYYVGLAGGNAWTMSTAADMKAAWTFTAQADGSIRINNLVTAGRFVGTNAAEKTAGSSCYADKLTSNGNVNWTITEYVEVDPNIYLTQEMYHVWTATDATAEIAEEDNPTCEYAVGTSAGNIYGNSNVPANQFADLTAFDELIITVEEGTPRLLLNRPTDDSNDYINLPNNAAQADKYIKSSENNIFVYDLAAIRTDYGFVHLNAIKGANWANATVVSMVLNTLPTFAITVAEAENGTVSAPESAKATQTVAFTATPAEGYELESISVTYLGTDGTAQEVEVSLTNTFVMPAADVTITATFIEEGSIIADDTDLTADLFHEWNSAVEAKATIVNATPGGEFNIGNEVDAGGTIYGNGSVKALTYADLTPWQSLVLRVEAGTPRLLFNRAEDTSSDFIEINAEGAYATIKPTGDANVNIWVIDLAKIATDYGYAHLNVMKATWGGAAKVTLAKLINSDIDATVATAISGIAFGTPVEGAYDLTGRKADTLIKGRMYIINGKKVLVK